MSLGWPCPAASASGASSAPDWLRAAAAETLPDYPKDTVAVVVLDEEQITVKDNGQMETLRRRAFRVLRPEAREDFSGIAVRFDGETRLSYLKAWTITSDGHDLAVPDSEAMERSMDDQELYSDIRVRAMNFPEVKPGSVIGYEYVQKQRPFLFEDRWEFQEQVPVRTSRLALQLPAGWEYSARWINYGEQHPQDLASNRHVWEVTDVPAVEIEPAMPPWESIAGRVGVKFFPQDLALRAKTDASWKDMGLWFAGLAQTRRVSTPPIHQKVADLISGISDPLAKIRALTEYMQRNVRYFGVEIGIGGYQPHSTGEVFSHQYGDCKDKATLLSAMLQEIGIDSYYVIVDTRRGVVRPDYPSMNFDHVILAIRLPGGVSNAGLFSIATHPSLGRLLFFDPTNEYVSLGYLPSYLQDNYGLVVTPQGGEILSLPLLPPSSNRLLRTGEFSLSPAGDLSGDVQETRWGGPAAQDRQRFMEEPPAKRADIFDEFLGSSLNNFTLTSASIGNLDRFGDLLGLRYKFTSQGYAKNAGDLLILRPDIVGALPSAILEGKPRKYPIQFREATRQDDVFDINLPAGYVVDELPPTAIASCEYASYRREIQVKGDKLHYQRTYEVNDIVVPTEKLDEVKTFLEQLAAADNASAVLRRANP